MKPPSGGSWQELFTPSGGNGRNAAWGHLLKSPSGSGKSQSLSSGISSVGSILWESPSHGLYKNSVQASSEIAFEEKDGLFSRHGNGSENYRQAALDFVLELAGPRFENSSGERFSADSLLNADEVPVPTFTVDRDMKCTFWNRKIAEFTGWDQGEVITMEDFLSQLFLDHRSSSKKVVEDVLKSILFGGSPKDIPLSIELKDGSRRDITLSVSVRTDPVGAVSGLVCVVVPQLASYGYSSALLNNEGCLPDSLSSDISCSRTNSFTNAGCKEETSDYIEATESSSAANSPRINRPRALVFDTISATRNSLASQLERCGIETTCASSSEEAVWRFEKGFECPEGAQFSIVFGEFQAIQSEGYAAVRQIRQLEEQSDQISSGGKAIIVAFVNMNRWNLAGMDNDMHEGMSAGVDAVIPSNIRMQQLRKTLRKLGLKSKYLEVPTSLPRAISGALHNPLNLSR